MIAVISVCSVDTQLQYVSTVRFTHSFLFQFSKPCYIASTKKLLYEYVPTFQERKERLLSVTQPVVNQNFPFPEEKNQRIRAL